MDSKKPNRKEVKEVLSYLKNNIKHDRSFIGVYILIDDTPSYFTYSRKISTSKLYPLMKNKFPKFKDGSIRRAIKDFYNYLEDKYLNNII